MRSTVVNAGRFAEVRVSDLRRWLDEVLDREFPRGGELGLRLVTDREMRRLNREFRGQDKTTDVLSFPGAEAAAEDGPDGYLGDVAVSVPQARRQAAERGHPLEREVRLLALHGILHCAGFDHERDDGGEFFRRERRLRRRWGSS